MSAMEILLYPNAVLRKKCEDVRDIDAGVVSIVSNMTEAMYQANGVGLAAPQVGIVRRIIVLDIGEGLLARAFQHEIDHLNGKLIIDRLSKIKRDLTVKKYKKLNFGDKEKT